MGESTFTQKEVVQFAQNCPTRSQSPQITANLSCGGYTFWWLVYCLCIGGSAHKHISFCTHLIFSPHTPTFFSSPSLFPHNIDLVLPRNVTNHEAGAFCLYLRFHSPFFCMKAKFSCCGCPMFLPSFPVRKRSWLSDEPGYITRSFRCGIAAQRHPSNKRKSNLRWCGRRGSLYNAHLQRWWATARAKQVPKRCFFSRPWPKFLGLFWSMVIFTGNFCEFSAHFCTIPAHFANFRPFCFRHLYTDFMGFHLNIGYIYLVSLRF